MNSTNHRTITVVNYHYCQPETNGFFSGLTGVRPEELLLHAKAMQRHYEPVDVGAFDDGVEEGMPARRSERPALLVTFDDGTRDVFEHALPILAERGIPAVLFCCSQPLLEGRVLDVQKIHMLQARLGPAVFRSTFMKKLNALEPEVELEQWAHLGLSNMYRYDDERARRFKFLLNVKLPYASLSEVLDHLFEAEFGDQAEAIRHIYMSRDQLLRARDMGFVIGLHGHAHRMMSRLGEAEQEREVKICAECMSEVLGERPRMFSYPYGVAGTFNRHTKIALGKNGITRAFTLCREEYVPGQDTDPLEIPRFDVNDIFKKDEALDGLAVSAN